MVHARRAAALAEPRVTVFEDGKVVSFHGVVLDISERKRAEHTNPMLIAMLRTVR